MSRNRDLEVLTKMAARDRALLALRAGPMPGYLFELRGIHSSALTDLQRAGLAERVGKDKDALWRLTPAGRDTCPRRRDLLRPEVLEGMS